jgi:hypothetical protein
MDNGLGQERLYTYQEISAHCSVCVKTVARWFRRRQIFRPTHNTVRIPQSAFDAFLEENKRRSGR